LDLLLLTVDPNPESVLPSLALLAHNVRAVPTEVSSILEDGSADVAIVDARSDLAAARGLCRLLGNTGAAYVAPGLARCQRLQLVDLSNNRLVLCLTRLALCSSSVQTKN
jgi:hypothetical protein